MPRLQLLKMTGLAAAVLAASACERDTSGLEPVPPNSDPIVFLDGFGEGVDFQAFSGSKVDAVAIDTGERYLGSAALRVTVPDPGSPEGTYAGGAFTTSPSRDLTTYNALTFWAKAEKAIRLDVAGLGNDNTGTSLHEAKWGNIALTPNWAKYVIPIPLPAKLTAERGLFFFAEGAEGAAGYDIWFDEVQFEYVTSIANPRPAMNTKTVTGFVGAAVPIDGTRTTFQVGAVDQLIEHQPDYFSYATSNEDVAIVDDGMVRVVGGGQASITAALDTLAAAGTLTVNAAAPPPVPAPVPTLPASSVTSIYSNSYTSVPVTSWSPTWDQADASEMRIAGNDTRVYTNLVYAAIEFTAPTIDATAMTHFHIDVWGMEGTYVRVKLVDFGPDGVFGGAPDAEHELTFGSSTTPAFTPGSWISLDIPLADFTNLVTRAHMAQLILSSDGRTLFVDNIYFHR